MTATIRIKGKAQRNRVPGEMNKTESRYASVLEVQRLAGEISRWDFEPETLKLAKNTRYEPDFRVILNDGSVVFVECKPNNWRNIPNQDDSNVKIKVAAEVHPYIFWRVTETKSKGVFETEVIEPR